jgi:hypothetical protein
LNLKEASMLQRAAVVLLEPAPSRPEGTSASSVRAALFFFHSTVGITSRFTARRRIEIRDQLLEEYGTTHLVMARIGFIFR